jgi:hypothetical protein
MRQSGKQAGLSCGNARTIAVDLGRGRSGLVTVTPRWVVVRRAKDVGTKLVAGNGPAAGLRKGARATGWNTVSLIPLLDGLVGDAQLRRHSGVTPGQPDSLTCSAL